MNATEYAKALEASRAACRKFSDAQADYRARKIGDAEFLAARRDWLESEKAFDAAYDLAQAAGVDLSDVRPMP